MRGILIGVLAGTVAGYVATLHGQLAPVPSPAPGVTNVTGAVAVSNEPTVLARQQGAWVVTCAQAPQRADAGPLLQRGEHVTLTYMNGDTETVDVSNVRADGWISVGTRRINLASVASIQP